MSSEANNRFKNSGLNIKKSIKEESEKKIYNLNIRLTKNEYMKLQTSARKLEISISDFARRLLFLKPIMTKIDVSSVNEMKRQGGLLKHYFNETGGQNKKLTEKILKEIQAIVKKIEKPFIEEDSEEVYQAKLAATFDKNVAEEKI